jgi:hypothetical protein
MAAATAAACVAGVLLGCAGRWTPPPEWSARPAPPAPFTVVALRIDDGRLGPQLALAARRAAAVNQTPFVELTSRWCRACHWLDRGMSDPAMARAFGGTYIVRVDVDQWRGRLEGSGLDYHAGPIPAFVALSPNGAPAGDWADPRAWGSEVPQLAAPVLADFFHGE